MRTLVALVLYVSLAVSIFAEQPGAGQPTAGQADQKDSAERVAFTNRQARLVTAYQDTGDYQAAERVLGEWLASEPEDSKSRMMIQNGLADLLREEGRNAEAGPLFAQIVDSPNAAPRQRLNALIGLADVDMHRANWKTSIEEWNEALEIARSRQDTESESAILRGLGRTWLTAGSPARAEPLLRRSLKMAESDAAALPLEVAASWSGMAEYYRAGDKLALAEDAWSHALTIEGSALGGYHPQVAVLMGQLAEVYSKEGKADLACDYAQRGADAMRQWFGEDSPVTATALVNLALVEQRAHTLGAAASHYAAAVRVLRRAPDLGSTLKTVMQRYAGLLKDMHRDQEAKALDAEVKAFRSN